jgi:hypothetical protein
MALTEVVSILIGAGGLGVGAYSYYRQRESKQRKQRLNELAEQLNDLREGLEQVRDGYESPLSKTDLAYQLDLLAKDCLAFQHKTGEPPTVKLAGAFEEEIFKNKEQALDKYRSENTWAKVNLTIDPHGTDYDSRLVYPIYDHLLFLSRTYQTLAEIQEHHKGTLEEFEPGLYDDIEGNLNQVIRESHGTVLDNSDGKEIEPDEYESVEYISEAIFNHFWRYEGIESDLQELSEKIGKLEETRTMILQASYS